MANVSFEISLEVRDKIIDFYKPYQVENHGAYIDFFAKYENTTITIYNSKKGYKVLFSGDNALYEAKIFNSDVKENVPKAKVETHFLTYQEQCGSDEVGFGDLFGPLVVVGAYYDDSLKDIVEKLDDSKKLKDEFILEFVPTILQRVKFSKLTVNNLKYNELIQKGYNMVEIKSKLHNQVLVNLHHQIPTCKNFYIDQFVSSDIYYRYNAYEKEVIDNVIFKTKGESHYPSVALASMIARYCFLKEMDALSNKYQMDFPKGAGITADVFCKQFVKKYGKDELKKVAKCNFANLSNL